MIAPLFGTGSGSNYTGYSNPEFDKLIAEGNQAADEATAISKWQEAEKVLYTDFAGHATQWRNNVGGVLDQRVERQDQPGRLHQHRRDHGELEPADNGETVGSRLCCEPTAGGRPEGDVPPTFSR